VLSLVYFTVSVRMSVVVFMFLFHRRLLVLSVEPCPSSSVIQFALKLSCACLWANKSIDWLIDWLTEDVEYVSVTQLSVSVRDDAGIIAAVDRHQIAQSQTAATTFCLQSYSHNNTRPTQSRSDVNETKWTTAHVARERKCEQDLTNREDISQKVTPGPKT